MWLSLRPDSLNQNPCTWLHPGQGGREKQSGRVSRERGAEMGSPRWCLHMRSLCQEEGRWRQREPQECVHSVPAGLLQLLSYLQPSGTYRWTRSLKGTAELLRGREAAARPRTGRARRGLPRDKGAAPRQGLEGKGETGYFLETGSGLHPLMPLGICWNLSHWAEQEPLGPAWPCPLPTSDAHSSLGAAGVAGRQAEGQAQGREPPDECPAKWQRGVIS